MFLFTGGPVTAEGAVDVSSLLMLRQLQKPGAPDAVGRIVDRQPSV